MSAPLNATFIHRQTLAGQVRFTTTELGELEAKIASAADRALASSLKSSSRLAAATSSPRATKSRPPPRRSPCSTFRARSRRSRSSAAMFGPEIDRSLDFIVEGGRHAVVEQAISDPFVANDCDLSPPSNAERGANLAAHRAEHGGQVDVSAPERADRRARPNGRLRAGEAREARRCRPPVLASRRGRRSRPRTLDLHGRDGGNRGDSQSGRRTFAGHPRRDRARHRDVRRPLDRLGGDRASARDKTAAARCSRRISTSSRRSRPSSRVFTTPPFASRNGRARWCSCTR